MFPSTQQVTGTFKVPVTWLALWRC